MDAVYVCRPGPNEPLRYSLRSLAENVTHDRVWIYGGAPEWVDPDFVSIVERPRQKSKYDTVTYHIEAACLNHEISDPFVLWNDDFYAVDWIGDVPRLHRGLMKDEVTRFWQRRDEWGYGLRKSHDLLTRLLDSDDPLLSYELHAPLVVHKTAMLAAIQNIIDARIPSTHRRTIYGNIQGLGGTQIYDPKMSGRAWLPSAGFVSSAPATFKSLALPRLRDLFPKPSDYEIAL